MCRNRCYIRDDITRVLTPSREVRLNTGQRFYETEEAYELRDASNTVVATISKDEVTTVETKDL